MNTTLFPFSLILVCTSMIPAFSRGDEILPGDETTEPAVSVECRGRLRHGVVAIGCETTGTTITFHRETWELQLQDEASQEFAARHHKEPVIVTGTLRKVDGPETKVRWIVDVARLTEFTPRDQVEEAATINIRGVLRAALSQTSDSPELSVHADDQIWKLEFAADEEIQRIAESLIGQSVFISGNVVPATEGVKQSHPKPRTLKNPAVKVSTIEAFRPSSASLRSFR